MSKTKINCSCLDCKYCDDNYYCTQDKVSLVFCSIATVNEGQQDFLRCKQFEERDDKEWLHLKECVKDMMGRAIHEFVERK